MHLSNLSESKNCFSVLKYAFGAGAGGSIRFRRCE
jgi:hypothetical protein